ncbi:MAG: outer membrane protein assembly factor BamA [Prevotellaceae bacterium]|jgi:outer membrane protein insertion porin family|nr:outer membrane protein assembly factor BamA [Prevotellaceae bacterium]
MRVSNRTLLLFFLTSGIFFFNTVDAQEIVTQTNVVIDFSNPKKYILADLEVKGVKLISKEQILNIVGLVVGDEVTIPGDQFSSVVQRLYQQRAFSDVVIRVDSLRKDSVYVSINLVERPRASLWDFTGIKKSERQDLEDRLKLRWRSEISDFILRSSSDIIKRFYQEKGFLNVQVTVSQVADTLIPNAVRVFFNVDRGDKVKIKKINFIGNENVKTQRLRFAMKNTKDKHILNLFSSKKFKEKEYPQDKQSLIQKFQEKGFFDARIIRDSIYYIDKKHLGIDIEVEEGQKYFFRNVTWTGNSIFPTESLNRVLMIEKGDVFDVVTLEKRLYSEPKGNIQTIYKDQGYVFCQIMHVEHNIDKDSIDVEIRIFEGKPAMFNNITINGNTITNEQVVRRQLFIRPGYPYEQTALERSARELMSIGLFNEEKVGSGIGFFPNQRDNTVDIAFNLEEKPSSQLEVAGGWGGNTFVGTLGVSFNNFSTRRMLEKKAWRPVPLGDAQTLSLRFQTSGTYYTAASASFIEPWLFGKKPTSLNLSAYFTRQTASTYFYLNPDQFMEIYGLAAGLGTRLKWPDSYFVLYNELSAQRYRLQDWQYYFIFSNGTSNNLSWKINLRRNSTDQPIYPRLGQDLSFALQLTPPYSLFKDKNTDFNSMTTAQRYKWIEYHKWTFQGSFFSTLLGKEVIGKDLVLMTRAQFGYLGYYNRKLGYSPFEGFLVGGDGMSGYNTYGADVIGLRGYKNQSLTPYANNAYSGNVYDKFTLEVRFPIILEPQSTIFILGFLEGGNCWSDIKDFNPFSIKRSAGVGVRVLLPIVGMLGIDWGYGFDPVGGDKRGGSNIHFVIGQQF